MAGSLLWATLLVDGYNIVGAWPELREARDRDSLGAARQGLIEALVNYSAFEGVETRIVFDACYQNHCSSHCEAVTPNVFICYTASGQTADTYIEKLCALLCRRIGKDQERVIVATSDRAQQLTILGYGAEWLSAQRLAVEVELVAKRTRRRQQSRRQSTRRFLSNRLDPIAQQRLAQLRTSLSGR